MSFHVYIAREGWAETPISLEEWRAACSAMTQLRLREIGPSGAGLFLAYLKGHQRQILKHSQGWGHAQNPNEELVEVMFALADVLGAQVFSERAKAYGSVADWRRRTKNFRERHASGVAELRRQRNRERLFWALLVFAGLATAPFLSWLLK